MNAFVKKSGGVPRVVVVTRPTELRALLLRHGTLEQAAFFLRTHGQDIAEVEARHRAFEATLATLDKAIPRRWRRSDLARADLDRFVFEPDDLVVCLGQDGLVANVAKYLDGQTVVGLNPDPSRFDGVLARHPVASAAKLLEGALARTAKIEERTMVEARTDDGQRLLALNEIFVGHRTHQSARYTMRWNSEEERQSSSGVVIATGTGATGWMRSIMLARGRDPFAAFDVALASATKSPAIPNALRDPRRGKAAAAIAQVPQPEESRLTFCVREAFPSVATRTSLVTGDVDTDHTLAIVSEMNEGGTLFGDGIEEDAIELRYGLRVELAVARERLHLVA